MEDRRWGDKKEAAQEFKDTNGREQVPQAPNTEGKHFTQSPDVRPASVPVHMCGWLLFPTKFYDLTVPEGRDSDIVLHIW